MGEQFLAVLNMSLTASYVIILVVLIRLLLKKIPKVNSYVLWGVVAFRLIIPFSFESMFSLMPRNTNAVPIPHDIIYQQSPQFNSGIGVVDSLVSESLPTPSVGSSVNPLQAYIEIGAYIWIIGMIVLLAYSFASVLLLKRQLKSAELVEKNIFEAKNLKTPFLLGLIRPKIYLPVGLNVEERRYILLHEQIHIRRKDHIIKIFAFLILSIHWFNPLVWIAFMLMSMDMELSCDEQVLKEMNEDMKKPYANSLLSLATGSHILNGSPIAFGEGNVKGRIKNVLNYKKPRFWGTIASIIVLIIVGIALLTNPTDSEQDLSFLKPNNMLSWIGDQEQVKIISADYGNTSVSGRELAKWLDIAENDWKRKNVPSPYELSPSITIHMNDETGNEIRFFESEPTLVMILYQDEYQYYKIPKEDYSAMAAMAGSGYPHVQSITFTEHENGNDSALITITDSKTIMRMAVLMQSGEIYHPSLFFNSTQNDIPPVPDYIRIEMIGDQIYHSYFLYTEDEKNYYIDEPYDHINGIDFNTMKSIITIFTDAGNKMLNDQTSFNVESNLTIIMSSPKTSSNPQDYINSHQNEYENFFKYGGDDALQYMLSQFEAGNAKGLRGQIMMLLCKELLGARNNVTDETMSPQDWYNALSIRQEVILPNYEYDGQDPIEKLIYDTEIEKNSDSTRGGFMVVAPKIFGSYEEENLLRVFVTTYSARYKLFGNVLSEEGGSIIPAAITYRKDDSGSYILEKYEQAGDGSEFGSSVRNFCIMPVSGKKIKGLADKIFKYNTDYEDIRTLLYDNLFKHLNKNGIEDATITNSQGKIEFSMSGLKYRP
ncbi:MAG: M56 family metallopeptidase [Velocimicrobium sp.]